MNKDFVNYKTALALKELGFDERCFGHYNPNGVFFWKILCSDEDNDHTLSVKDIMEHVADGYVEAPLYQQAFRWFREKHKLISDIEYQPINSQKWGFLTYVLGEEPDYENWFYETYEEAEQACLDKLIEIVKNIKK